MTKLFKSPLSSDQQDALKEIMNIGAGHAATALSQMLKKPVRINVPSVAWAQVEKAGDVFGAQEQVVSTVYLRLLGDLTGVILFSFSKDQARRLAALLLNEGAKPRPVLSEIAQSALKETANIRSGAYLGALTKFLKLKLLISTPGFAEDMAGAVVDGILIETSQNAQSLLAIETELTIAGEKIQAYFFFVPDTASFVKVLEVMGVQR